MIKIYCDKCEKVIPTKDDIGGKGVLYYRLGMPFTLCTSCRDKLAVWLGYAKPNGSYNVDKLKEIRLQE
jgi:hypothetical protein